MTQAPVTPAALVDVDAVAAAVTACPGVAGLYGGPGDAIASYLPGRRVPGVEVNPPIVALHVRSRWGISAAELLTEISVAAHPLLHGMRLEVTVADIDDPDSTPPTLPASTLPVSTPVPVPVVAMTGKGDGDTVVPEAVALRPPGSAPSASPPTPTPAPATFPVL